MEGVEHVLAVRGADLPLELQLRRVEFVRLVGAGGQAVAAGEDDPLVLGQTAACPADAVESDDGPGEGVEHQVAVGVLLVGADAQEDQGAHPRVGDVRVRQRLQRLVDRLGVDALCRLGVVVGLDGEDTAYRGDEDLAADGDVRVPSEDVVLARAVGPFDVVGRRHDVVALAPRVQERDRSVVGQGPAQHPCVVRLLAGLEHGEQPALGASEPEEASLAVVAVQSAELADEGGVVEQAGDSVIGQPFEFAVVQGQDVTDARAGLPARDGVGADEQCGAHRHDVPGHRGVLRAQPLGRRRVRAASSRTPRPGGR